MAEDGNIVERLRGRANNPLALKRDAEVMEQAADRLERLEAAGDALVGALENNLMATAVVLVNQWKEARRE